jgi:hypothetical protein
VRPPKMIASPSSIRSVGAPAGPKFASTWSEFLEAIRKARKELGDPTIVWYRGQSREHYRLTPSLLRHPLGISKEQALFNEYERSAARLHAPRSNDWQLLIDMQHYGIPTRLMDWTDVLGVALAFALYDSGDDHEDSVIYVLDPLGLNALSGLDEIKRVPNDAEFKYKSIYWHGRPFKAVFPIAIDSAFQNDRIAAQSGSFTVHGAKLDPIDDQAPSGICKIVLRSSAKPEAREFLEYANLNTFSIYPDIVGMARHIVRKHLE